MTILLLFLLPLVGCSDAQYQLEASLDSEANVLTIDGVRYLRNEELVDSENGWGQWNYCMEQKEQTGRIKEKDSHLTYQIYVDTTDSERRFLYGHYEGFYPSRITYEVWFREDMLMELTDPMTTNKVFCEALSTDQLSRLLALHNSTELENSLSYDDAETEVQAFEIENFRLWRQIDFLHTQIGTLSYQEGIYFSARTGEPYLSCMDGRLRRCPQDIIEALGLSPDLPPIYVMIQGDTRLSLLSRGEELLYQAESVSLNELKREYSEKQTLWELQFRIDIYDSEDDSWPVYILKGYYHPKTGVPYLQIRDGTLRKIPSEAVESLGL